jgi:hypothetical protein
MRQTSLLRSAAAECRGINEAITAPVVSQVFSFYKIEKELFLVEKSRPSSVVDVV